MTSRYSPIFLFLAIDAASSAQQVGLVTRPNPTSVAAACEEIERRYGVPIHYEAARSDHPDDVAIIRLSDVRSSKPWEPDIEAARAAVNAVSNAHKAYRAAEHEGDLFVTGLNPVLSTRITLQSERRFVLDAIKAAIKEVATRSGFRIELGRVPVRLLTMAEVRDAVINEPANIFIARVLKALPLSPTVNSATARRTTSYQLLFDPLSRVYTLDINTPSSGAEPLR